MKGDLFMKKKVFSLLLAGMLALSMGTTAYATEGEIADMQAQKQEAEAGLAQAQANISSLEDKKQELENYLSDLNAQYEELTNTISDLSIQAGEKENQLKEIRAELKKAKKASEKQYEDMKLRIQYMYENGGTTALQTILSSKDLSEFLNNAESIANISQYDRSMLEKYENLQETIKEQETQAEEEKASIDALLAERASKQQEVQNMAASTSDNISSYVSQISASQEEAALTEQINSADTAIAQLVQQAEEEKAAREAEAARAAAEAAAAQEAAENEASQDSSEDSSDDYSEYDTVDESSDVYNSDSDSYSNSEDAESYDEDSYTEDSESSDGADYADDTEYTEDTSDSSDYYEEDTYDESDYADSTEDSSASEESQVSSESSSSGQGTYLGNFTLTAYCNCAQCCGTAGNLTASGTVPTAGRTVAMAGVPFGTQLLINGNVYTVEDLGTPYGHVDIYCGSHSEALSFGLQTAEVYRLN